MITENAIHQGRILIVDDQEANVTLLEQMLRGGGYTELSSTMDPTAVCALHLQHHYDLILLDILMPVMDGFEVMENLKTIETDGYLPVLVVTAQSDHKLRALKAGAKDFVSKPFDLAEVLLRVHNMLEVRLLHVETGRLYERVLEEQKVSERLLGNLLPAANFPHKDGTDPGIVTEGWAEATVLFADLVACTRFAEGADAQVLKEVLHDLSSRFDRGPGVAGAERLRVQDNAYLATAEAADALADHTMAAVDQVLDLNEALERFNRHNPYHLRVRLELREGAALEAPASLG
jgi:adenylate cyclase